MRTQPDPPSNVFKRETGQDHLSGIAPLGLGNGSSFLMIAVGALCSVMLFIVPFASIAQSSPAISTGVHGKVLNAAGIPVAGAAVHLKSDRDLTRTVSATDAQGSFSFRDLSSGIYTLFAETPDLRSETVSIDLSTTRHEVDLVLNRRLNSDNSGKTAGQTMEFADEPKFTVAGVTDWTAAGGHGSDATLRTSEGLTREILTLKSGEPQGSGTLPTEGQPSKEIEAELRTSLASQPMSFEANRRLGEFYVRQGRYADALVSLQTAYRLNMNDSANEYDLALACKNTNDLSEARKHVEHLLATSPNADVHRLAGQIDERLEDPLAAVHEFEMATTQDPSEQNYFEWGSELLLHRAVWQAKAVFESGLKAHPRSRRLLTGLGAALFAGALYDQAAQRLCEASDLSPNDVEPYMLLGRVVIATPNPLACARVTLARFVREQPNDSLANYFYAMAIWRDSRPALDEATAGEIEALLAKTVKIDPKCGDAYLQLGNLKSARRDYHDAIDFYNKAIDVNPQLSEAHYRLAVAYDRVGDKQKANGEFKLHETIEKEQAAAVERQRREVKQFVIVLPSSSKTN